ncbi:hydrolase [Algibacter pacificus]|uniref:hydrolase n=1 Tax=Algibacter pacificus TaxID=2599389 RepID=UPI0011C89157|nr:hydrolase [Algibacter pacificus]
MAKRIFMYLFMFSMLLVLFQYVNSKHVFEEMNTKLGKQKAQVDKYKDSVLVLNAKISNLSYFNLEKNEDALSYFERDGFDTEELIPYIKDELYALNEVKGEHPLIPYASSEGHKMLINKVKLLNHKWIIADFSDGEFWGELFLTYQVTDKKKVTFNLVESFLYPLQ